MEEKSLVIFFDGVCNLCNSSVQFIIKHDKKKIFRFASLQSNYAKDILTLHGVSMDLQSIILLENGNLFKESDAVLKISKYLGWKWKLIGIIGFIFPEIIRNYLYRIIAKNRYKWFGKKDRCMIPTPEIKSRFLGE